MTTRILHLIEKLTLGGAAKSLLGLVRNSDKTKYTHTSLSLLPPDQRALQRAQEIGLEVMAFEESLFSRQIEETDIVQIHFWNAPSLYRILHRPWPAARVLCWSHISGEHPPQVLTPGLASFCDALVASTPHTAELPAFKNAAQGRLTDTILDMPDFATIKRCAMAKSGCFTVVYVGTVDFVKMHLDFVEMHAKANIPNLRVIVCGDGAALNTLKQQAARSTSPERFEFVGYQEFPEHILSQADVFGYPLAPETYATSELALQEAMYLCLPPLLLSNAGPARMVEHGVTGLLARDPADYAKKLEELAANPILRETLGKNAAAFAAANWGAEQSAKQMAELYENLLHQPKRYRPPVGGKRDISGVESFLASLGESAPQFRDSFEGRAIHGRATERAADRFIEQSSALLASASAGGVLHYRIAYPDDPFLRYWSGLVLANQGRTALAAMEFCAAAKLGFDDERLAPHTLSSGPKNEIVPHCKTPVERSPSHSPTPFTRLWSDEGTVIFCGNSVTAQRKGYRPLTAQWIKDEFSCEFSIVNATLGGVGSFGSAFLLHRALDQNPHQEALCLIECLTGDIGNRAKPDEIAADLEGVARRLLESRCTVIFLLLYHDRQDTADAIALKAIYCRIAERYGIPVFDVAKIFGEAISSGSIATSVLFKDRVHTRPIGSYLTARAIARQLRELASNKTDTKKPLPVSLLYPTERPFLHTWQLNPGNFPDEAAKLRWGVFQLANRYIEIGVNESLEIELAHGELAGFFYINGPHSGSLRVEAEHTDHTFTLQDKWSHFERLHTLRSESSMAEKIKFRLSPTGIGFNGLPGRLFLTSILLRSETNTPPKLTIKLIAP